MWPLAVQGFSALRLVEHEFALFAGFWFCIGVADELAIDLVWLWLRLVRRARALRVSEGLVGAPLQGIAAVFVPAWHEATVIASTVNHMREVWPQADLRIYVGCYPNDLPTLSAAMGGAEDDPRVRLVMAARPGPTTKADCLNRLYRALCDDEARSGREARLVLLHDAEDMVHPAALAALDAALGGADFVQLPVRPEPQPGSRWVAGHYSDEFTEAHAKAMVVRDALGAALPSAGVGCAVARPILARLAMQADGRAGPFDAAALTEDYELGWNVTRAGGRSRFLRLRDECGTLIATRSYFPHTLGEAVRQKTRWVHGIAFQGWDRLGWSGRAVDVWMALRDRRGPLVALVLAASYALLVVSAVLWLAEGAGLAEPVRLGAPLRVMLAVCAVGVGWRLAVRFAFTAREYGWREGLLALPRVIVANLVAIVAARRALVAYGRSLSGHPVAWDKTAHHAHPAFPAGARIGG